MKKSALSVICAIGLFTFQPAYAAELVDTGPGPEGPTGWTLDPSQSLAAEFVLRQDSTITSVEGWIASILDGSLFTASIFSDGGNVPGSVLFSSSFAGGAPGTGQWQGAYGLSWNLAAGTYWVGFSGQSGLGSMPNSSANPLGNEAFTLEGNWVGFDNLSIGARIRGNQGFNNPNTGAVPEPSTWAMLILGFFGVGAAIRSARREQNVTVSYA
ncbi:MAG: PEPxxWA-CTERM sorting domain-containing protein [Erythrobacteraceae bacterium]|jgi:hypothetical protein